MDRQLMLSELLLNPSVPAADQKRLSKQAIKIWRLFDPNGDGHYLSVWTPELRAVAAQYQSRLSELRAWLAKYGLTIDKIRRSERGNYKYEVREFEGSNYQRLLRKKGLA